MSYYALTTCLNCFQLAQLHHELTRKEELLHLYMQDAREKEGEQGKEMEKCVCVCVCVK